LQFRAETVLTISPKNTHILNGNAEDLYKECEDYENAIVSVGGIDLFLGGIGAGKSLLHIVKSRVDDQMDISHSTSLDPL
jgi:hypothetical protein